MCSLQAYKAYKKFFKEIRVLVLTFGKSCRIFRISQGARRQKLRSVCKIGKKLQKSCEKGQLKRKKRLLIICLTASAHKQMTLTMPE
jgi:ribosomal protein L36